MEFSKNGVFHNKGAVMPFRNDEFGTSTDRGLE